MELKSLLLQVCLFASSLHLQLPPLFKMHPYKLVIVLHICSLFLPFRSYLQQRKTDSKRRKEQSPVLDHLLAIVQSPLNKDTTYLSRSWAALVVLPHIR